MTMFIANILTRGVFDDDGMYNVVKDKSMINTDIPTLVIGFDFAKENYGKINTLDWTIDKNTYWTFSNREKRQRYDEDVKKFTRQVINDKIKSVEYEFKNILTMSVSDKKSFVNEINNAKHGVSYLNNDVIYLCLDKHVVYGVSLKDIEYCGCDKSKIAELIMKNKSIKILKNQEIGFKMLKAFEKNKYVIPSLFF